MKNGKELKKLLKVFKENRDKIEKRTGKRPEIDDTTKLFMQKILNVWLSEGKDIDDEKFWNAVDYNKQFDYPVEYYERWIIGLIGNFTHKNFFNTKIIKKQSWIQYAQNAKRI